MACFRVCLYVQHSLNQFLAAFNAHATLPLPPITLKTIVTRVANRRRESASLAEDVSKEAQKSIEPFKPISFAVIYKDRLAFVGNLIYLLFFNWVFVCAARMTTQFTKLFSFILANVADPPRQEFEAAYRMQCHSCMSPYLEDQFVYISHLYRKPLSFTDKCDRQTFDWKHVKLKNCTDLCVSIRMNDKIGGRRRSGYMRGCMSDIKYYNRSVLYYGDVIRTGHNPQHTRCQMVRLRDLFAAPDWYGFDSNDHVELCTCHTPMCNTASNIKIEYLLLLPTFLLTISAFSQLFPTRRKT